MIRLALFDIDGTLIHTHGAGEKAFARVCALEFNVPNGTAGLSFAGRTDPAIVRDFFRLHQIEPSAQNFRRFYDCYVFLLEHFLPQTGGKVLPGVWPWLDSLAELPDKPAVGLLTGNIRLGAQIKLRHFNLWDRFVMGAFGDDHENRNNLAAVAQMRASHLLGSKVRGEEILVIGDTPLDIECGKAIGAKTLAVATGRYSLQQLEACAPDWTVPDLAQASVPDFFDGTAGP